MADQTSSHSKRQCWWPGCTDDASTLVTANDVTRAYCPEHAQQVERYYAEAARWEAAHAQAEQLVRRPPRTDEFGDPMPDAYSTFWKG